MPLKWGPTDHPTARMMIIGRVKGCTAEDIGPLIFLLMAELFTLLDWSITTESNIKWQNVMFYVRVTLCHKE